MRPLLVLLLLTTLAACADIQPSETAAGKGARASAGPALSPATAARPTPNVGGGTSLPSGLTEAVRADKVAADLAKQLRAERESVPAELRLKRSARGASWSATNRARKIRATFAEDRVTVTADDRSQINYSLRRWGRGGALTGVRAAQLKGSSRGVEYVRPGITEWYANTSAGLEQGFTVSRKPEGEGALRIEVGVGAGVAVVTAPDSDRDLLLRDVARGNDAFRVTALYAEDARGKRIPARFETGESSMFAIVVDDRNAEYPLLIDPVTLTGSTSFTGTTSASGFRVAIYGTSALVGDPDADGGKGLVTAYTYTAPNWVYVDSQYGSTAGDRLGESVALGGLYGYAGASGAGYVRVYNLGTLTTVTTILGTPPDGTGQVVKAFRGDEFGGGDHDYTAIGEPNYTVVDGVNSYAAAGRVRIYKDLVHIVDLTASNHLSADRHFGAAIAIGLKFTTVGAPGYNGTGAVFAHKWTTDYDGFTAYSVGSQGVASALEGQSLAYYTFPDGDGHLWVGAPGVSAGRGAVNQYTVSLSDNTLGYVQSMTLGGGAPGDQFGQTLAMEGLDVFLAGAPGAGKLGVFARSSDGSFYQSSTLSVGTGFGSGVSLWGTHALVGGTSGTYHYTVSLTNGSPALESRQCESGIAVDGVCCATTCGNDLTDCQACSTARGAVVDGTCAALAPFFAYQDLDGDGFGNPAVSVSQCVLHGTYSTNKNDCDDTSDGIHPGAVDDSGDSVDEDCSGDAYCPSPSAEICDDLDNNCNGLTDENCDPDGDDYCDASMTVIGTPAACPNGGGDCSEYAPTSAAIHPDAVEIPADYEDQNCDGLELCYDDADDDLARLATATTVSVDLDCDDDYEAKELSVLDCDDTNAAIRPGTGETVGDEIDQNCDGAESCYAWTDADGDGHAAMGSISTVVSFDLDCGDAGEHTAAERAAVSDDDCDDSNAARYVGAVEIVGNEVDEDCNGSLACYADADGDGYRTESVVSRENSCTGVAGAAPASAPSGDCDDSLSWMFPGAAELESSTLCMGDRDGDGYGATPASGASVAGTDCDDTLDGVRPGVTEIPVSSRDDNCDGLELCYVDADGDGVTSGATVLSATLSCIGPGLVNYQDSVLDCDDNDPARGTGDDQFADGIDGDCDGREVCIVDADDDGYLGDYGYEPDTDTYWGLVWSVDADCDDSGEGLYGSPEGDCNDEDAAINPGATEIIGDEVDGDCDGYESCFADYDFDGARTNTLGSTGDDDCDDLGEGEAGDPLDCDDNDDSRHPGASETPADGIDADCDGGDTCFADVDNDGYRTAGAVASADLDCNDAGEAVGADPSGDCDDVALAIHPGASEVCDSVDNDCDGGVDEDVQTTYYRDTDLDGFGDPVQTTLACSVPGGYVVNSVDCDDGVASSYPLATEVAGDEVDSDCDGTEVCYRDTDNDGYRTSATFSSSDDDCDDEGEASASEPTGDTDDNNAGINPGVGETVGNGIDDNSDGVEVCYVDADDDGYRTNVTVISTDADCNDAGEALSTEPDGDSDDADAAIHPGAVEVPGDGVDQNSDGGELCYADADNDGYRTEAIVVSSDADCSDSGEALVTESSGDTNEADASINPGATESAGDNVDQNGDGRELCYVDADDDAYRTDATFLSLDADCNDNGEALASDPDGDTNDSDASVNPGATEVPGDGVDQDSDGNELCYVDADNDGYRTAATLVSIDTDCDDSGEALAAEPSGDTNDSDASTHPGATEVPGDGIDQDSDGSEICYADADNDGYRTADTMVSADADCSDSGEALATDPSGDTQDGDPTVHPGATEQPGDGVDQNGDGRELCYVDADNDGYRTTATVLSLDADCGDSGESLASDPSGDTDDSDSSIHPGATERPGDSVDQNGDGRELCFVDADNDGYRTALTVLSLDADCDDSGEAVLGDPTGDTNDSDPAINPGALEQPGDGVDQNGDGLELCYRDTDDDGYRRDDFFASLDADCSDSGEALAADPTGDTNDSDPGINPGATELPGDLVDQNGDGSELCYVDADNDGYRTDATVASLDSDCDDSGEALGSEPRGDSNDNDSSINPGREELPGDLVDQNGDGRELCYVDADDDGYRTEFTVLSVDDDCDDSGEALESEPSGDTNDRDATIHPGATELAGDGRDQDGDGTELCFVDGDDDGYRLDTVVASVDVDCEDSGEAYAVEPTGDVDDEDASVNPGVGEIPGNGRDDNSDGGEVCYADADEDGVRSEYLVTSLDADCDDEGEALATEPSGDCGDTSADVRPGATEHASDGLDSDCDGTELCFDDADDDGDRAAIATVVSLDLDCDDAREGRSFDAIDCDEMNPAVYSGATEVVGNGVDDNCDGAELCVAYVDADNDGHAAIGSITTVVSVDLDCTDAGEYVVAIAADDCLDSSAVTYPGASEIIGDEVDNDCNGREVCYLDQDADGFRDTDTVVVVGTGCRGAGRARASTPSGDCNDADPYTFPGSAELDSAVACMRDHDRDGYGDSLSTGLTVAGADCDDGSALKHPGAVDDRADGIDADCDGHEYCLIDLDDDGYAISAGFDDERGYFGYVLSDDSDCEDLGEALATANGGDCVDSMSFVNPGFEETCDGIDNNCDSDVDPDCRDIEMRRYVGEPTSDSEPTNLDLGDARVFLPAGSLAASTTAWLLEYVADGSYGVAVDTTDVRGRVWEVGPRSASSSPAGTIWLRYGAADPETLVLSRWDEEMGAWVAVAGAVVDGEFISAPFEAFGVYALIARSVDEFDAGTEPDAGTGPNGDGGYDAGGLAADSSVVRDASTGLDASVPESDASVQVDTGAGAADAAVDSGPSRRRGRGAGSGCSVASHASDHVALLMLGLSAFALSLRRRRR